ncbi:MAG TPA: hypothetical protein VH593_24370 [Ktedonobacteraceae bacterium]|jgi:hypothetical protein
MNKEDEEEYYVLKQPTIFYDEEDYPEHNTSGFCDNMGHMCHENSESINDLNQAIQNGEITPDDADRIYRGKTVI